MFGGGEKSFGVFIAVRRDGGIGGRTVGGMTVGMWRRSPSGQEHDRRVKFKMNIPLIFVF